MCVSTEKFLVVTHIYLVLSQKSYSQKNAHLHSIMTVITKKNLSKYKNLFPALKNVLLQNKIPVFTQKSILAYKSASFSHKNVCLHSQMPLHSQIWQSAQKTHEYKNDSSALKNSLVHTKMTAFAQKCLSGHKSASSKHKCIFILKYVCHSSKDPCLSTKCLAPTNNSIKYMKMYFWHTKMPCLHSQVHILWQ